MNTAKLSSLLILCVCATACADAGSQARQPPRASAGVMDLRGWDFETDGSVVLEGEWAFHWRELLPPERLTASDSAPYVGVPDLWGQSDMEGLALTPEGFATYALTLYMPDTLPTYGLYIDGQGSAYSLWVDGRLIARNGRVGEARQAMTPERIPRSVFFEPDGERVEVVMQISNFHHRTGGFRTALVLGLAKPIHSHQLQGWFLEAFAGGILIVMGLYHFFLFAFRRRDRATLYFALMCWIAAVRTGVTNQSILLFHLPIISWSYALRLEYLTFFLAPVAFALFLQALYPRDIHRWFVRSVVGLGLGFTLLVFALDTMTLSYTAIYYQAALLLQILYYLGFLINVNRLGREGARYIALASLVIFSGVILEILYVRGIIDTVPLRNLFPDGQISAFTFLAFIFVQAILLASRSAKAFARVEALSEELETTNNSLEQSERRYRNLFEDSKDMIFIAGEDGGIEGVSPACEEVLRYTHAEMLQMTLLDVIVDPVLGLRFMSAVMEKGSVRNFEVDLMRKDGEIVHALVSATARRAEDGRVTGVQGNVRDITARKQVEAERLRALKLEQVAITDPLTSAYNRRFFDQVAGKEVGRANRGGVPISLILLDIDRFKSVNDDHGHPVGDQVLVNLAALCQHNLRTMDLFARYGGDEFVIVMPNTDTRSAHELAERLRRVVSGDPLATSGTTDLTITISLGVVSAFPDSSTDVRILLERADRALYRSKRAGRDRASVWTAGDS